MAVLVPAFYIYMWLVLATAWLSLTIALALFFYDALRWVWYRLF